MIDVAVIGGGISGLTVAHELLAMGRSVVVLERQVAVGGNAVSQRFGDYLMEHGPSSLNPAAADTTGLFGRLGLDNEQVGLGAKVKYRYLTKNGRLSCIPTHPLGFFTSSHLSPRARLALAGEMFKSRKRGNCEESVDSFCRRRFGPEFAERVIDPLTGGLFAASSGDLSVSATFPALVDMENKCGSIIAGAFRRRISGGKMPARRLASWRNGIGTLPRTLAAGLASNIRTGIVVRRIDAAPDGFTIDTGSNGKLQARTVVVATQPHVAGALLETIDRKATEAALAVSAPPIAVVFLGYRRSQVTHPLEGIGYLTASSEGRDVSGALFPSSMFPERAPPGHVALSAYVGGSRAPDLALQSPEVLIDTVRQEFADILGASGEPVIARVKQWPRGLPQTSLGHQKRMDVLVDCERGMPGLFLTGNYFTGPGIAACLARATETVGRIEQHLLQAGHRESVVNIPPKLGSVANR